HIASRGIYRLSLHDARPIYQQLLDYLELQPGMQLNAEILQTVHQKLRESCRFWKHSMIVHLPVKGDDRYASPASGVTLQIDLLRSEEHTSELQSREKLVCRL